MEKLLKKEIEYWENKLKGIDSKQTCAISSDIDCNECPVLDICESEYDVWINHYLKYHNFMAEVAHCDMCKRIINNIIVRLKEF